MSIQKEQHQAAMASCDPDSDSTLPGLINSSTDGSEGCGKKDGSKECEFCCNPHLSGSVTYKCGTRIKKFFPEGPSKPKPGWYSGEIVAHSVESGIDPASASSAQILAHIAYEDGDAEQPSEESLLKDLKVKKIPPGSKNKKPHFFAGAFRAKREIKPKSQYVAKNASMATASEANSSESTKTVVPDETKPERGELVWVRHGSVQYQAYRVIVDGNNKPNHTSGSLVPIIWQDRNQRDYVSAEDIVGPVFSEGRASRRQRSDISQARNFQNTLKSEPIPDAAVASADPQYVDVVIPDNDPQSKQEAESDDDQDDQDERAVLPTVSQDTDDNEVDKKPAACIDPQPKQESESNDEDQQAVFATTVSEDTGDDESDQKPARATTSNPTTDDTSPAPDDPKNKHSPFASSQDHSNNHSGTFVKEPPGNSTKSRASHGGSADSRSITKSPTETHNRESGKRRTRSSNKKPTEVSPLSSLKKKPRLSSPRLPPLHENQVETRKYHYNETIPNPPPPIDLDATDKEQETPEFMEALIQNFRYWLRYHYKGRFGAGNISLANFNDTTLKCAVPLICGLGVFKNDAWFRKGKKLKWRDFTNETKNSAKAWQEEHLEGGVDSGHGWLLLHPLTRMIEFREQWLAQQQTKEKQQE